jgi:hypothetical protein
VSRSRTISSRQAALMKGASQVSRHRVKPYSVVTEEDRHATQRHPGQRPARRLPQAPLAWPFRWPPAHLARRPEHPGRHPRAGPRRGGTSVPSPADTGDALAEHRRPATCQRPRRTMGLPPGWTWPGHLVRGQRGTTAMTMRLFDGGQDDSDARSNAATGNATLQNNSSEHTQAGWSPSAASAVSSWPSPCLGRPTSTSRPRTRASYGT